MPVIGRAGGSLENPTFLTNTETAVAGRAGELATARILDRLAISGGFTVLHDLRIPRAKANIDHIVVAGREVTVIDSKMWKPGFYSTLFGRTRRGTETAPHADKAGLPLGNTRISELLLDLGLAPIMRRPLMVVHSSRPGERLSLWAYRPASTPKAHVRAIHPEGLRFPAQPADSRIVAALSHLVI